MKNIRLFTLVFTALLLSAAVCAQASVTPKTDATVMLTPGDFGDDGGEGFLTPGDFGDDGGEGF